MSIDHGGQAFPTEGGSDSGLYPDPGMSLRDYFAAKAMQGILAGPCSRDGATLKEWFDIPEIAYRLADAMLNTRAALTKAQGQPSVSGGEESQ